MTTKVKVALVGGGRMGSLRAELIARHPRASLEYVVDSNEEIANKIASLNGAKAVSDLSAIIDKVDAIWISTPTHLHPQYIKLAAASKKAVATEKPVAFTPEETKECFEACEKNGVPFLVAFNRRSDPHFMKFKETLQQHGPAHIIRIVNGDHPLPPKELFAHLGSIFEDFLVHDFDTSLFLTGETPTQIYAVGTQMLPDCKGTQTLDTALVHLSFPSGTQVSIEASRYSPGGYDQRLEAVTKSATIRADNPAKTEVVVVEPERVSHDIYHYSFPQRYYLAYSNEVDHFVKMILDGAPAKVTLNECLIVDRMVRLATQSHEQKKAMSF